MDGGNKNLHKFQSSSANFCLHTPSVTFENFLLGNEFSVLVGPLGWGRNENCVHFVGYSDTISLLDALKAYLRLKKN